MSVSPRYRWNFEDAQWLANVDDEDDGNPGHFVYGEFKSRVLTLVTRAHVIFVRDLSLECYMQSFVAAGEFRNFKELARTDSYEFRPYSGLQFNPDFKRRSLRSNVVLRWEYRPGSTFFFVWSQSRSAFSTNPSFQPLDEIRQGFFDAGSNLFFIKLNYQLAF